MLSALTCWGCTSRPFQATAPAGMVWIRGGTYTPLFKTEDTQTIEPFWLDRHPVTNAQFLAFVKARPKWRRSRVSRLFADSQYLAHWQDDLTPAGPDGRVSLDAPVVNVSWFAARAYSQWRGARLPTRGEWERVAAASETEEDGRSNASHYQNILNWYSKPTPKKLPDVGSTTCNYWGVWDMHGLVWEWVSDFNTALVTGDSRGDSSLDRGLFCGAGSVGAADFQDYAAFMRYAFRSSLSAQSTTNNLGFRCASSSTPPPSRETTP